MKALRLRFIHGASSSSLSCSSCSDSTASHVSSNSSRSSGRGSGSRSERRGRSYRRIRMGLRKSVPAAIVLWAFHKMPSNSGLSSRQVINFLKRHYRVVDDPRRTGKSIGSMLRCAVEFGLLERRGQKYFLISHRKNR